MAKRKTAKPACSKHRTYKGAAEPRSECLACWKHYALVQQGKVKIMQSQANLRRDLHNRILAALAVAEAGTVRAYRKAEQNIGDHYGDDGW